LKIHNKPTYVNHFTSKLILQLQKYFDFIKAALPLYTSVGWLLIFFHNFYSNSQFYNLNIEKNHFLKKYMPYPKKN